MFSRITRHRICTWFQSESGLYQNWMRDYDPTTGRYLQADPLGLVDGASIYGYVKGNPGRWADFSGLATLFLTNGGWIIHKDWRYVPLMPPNIGNVFYQTCSQKALVFHRATNNDGPHWHFYPEGQTKGGLGRGAARFTDETGNDHLYPNPVYKLEVEDCPCDGDTANNASTAAILLFLLLLLSFPEGAPAVGAM